MMPPCKTALVAAVSLSMSVVMAEQDLQGRAACASQWGQCGGLVWTGPTCCAAGTSCQVQNPYYSQCLAVSGSSAQASTTTKAPTSKSTTSTAPASTTSSSPPVTAPASSRLGGVNLAGFDFGMSTSGSSGTYVAPPKDQISHFIAAGSNVFRLPFGWQYMEPAGPGSGLGGIISSYDTYVQAMLSAGAFVILDVHNYGRWNGAIVGSGGPTTAQFAALWSALATKYKSQSKVIFGIMNEPHDLDIASWTVQVQAAVNAIRAAGAKTQYILLPGTGWTGGGSFISTNEPNLSKVTDPVGGTSLLIYDIHQYLDSDSSGTNTECVSDKISDIFAPITALLKSKGRKAFLSEIGASNAASCQKYLKSSLAHVAANSGQWLGFTTWAAGAFDTSYVLTETPSSNGVDQPIFANAVKPNLPGASKRRLARGH